MLEPDGAYMPVETLKCPTHLLADNPTSEDAFGHKKVAVSIAELITTERGAKCVGLNGTWGSGKSSVVELLYNELHRIGQGNIDLFVFDAWAHQTSLTDLTSNGYIAQHLSTVASNPRAAALCIMRILEIAPSGVLASPSAPQAAAGLSLYLQIITSPDKRQDAIRELAELLIKHKKVEILYSAAEKVPSALPFIYAVLKLVADRENAFEYFPTARLVEEWDFLKAALGDQLFEKLIRQSIHEANLAIDMTGYDFSVTGVRIDRFMLQAGASDPKYLDYLVDGLASLDKAAWLDALSKETETLDLLAEIAATGKGIALKSAFEDALLEHAQRVIDETTKVERLKGSWDVIFQTLDKNFRVTALKKMIETLCDSPRPTDPLLDLYSLHLADPTILRGNEQRIALLAFPLFLSRLRLTELQWMCTVLEKSPNFLIGVAAETRKTLEDRILDATEQETVGEEISKALHRLTQLAGIDLEKSKQKREKSPSPTESVDGEGSANGEKRK